MKLLNVVGARPQFVKAAVISRAISKRDDITEVIVHTGQHFDNNMSEIFFKQMQIPKPDYFLNINGMNHGAMTGRMIIDLEELMIRENPDYVLVYGDTNTTLAAALAAKKLDVKIVHIEAGVRNFDESMPEEINRYLVDRMSHINIACTWLSEDNLRNEGYMTANINSNVFNLGDVMYDAALFYSKLSDKESDIIERLNLKEKDFILSTVHRASNTDNRESLQSIVSALNKINEEIPIILPLHPRTKAKLEDYGLEFKVNCIDPIGYFDMLELVKASKYVLTDSGGVIREAYFFSKPAIMLIENTVWPELVMEGACFSVKPEMTVLLDTFNNLKNANPDFSKKIYGDGNAGEKIVEMLEKDFRSNDLI
jgi:UDP-GlcNAc3NAcA epimerase